MKTVRCKSCRDRIIPKGNSTLNQYCDKVECRNVMIRIALEKSRQKIKKQTKEINQKARQERKQTLDRLKSLSDWKNDLQTDINLIARLIDKGCPCIATGKYEGKMSGGHFIAVGANETIRFNLLNIHVQSFHSNSWKGGDNLRYREGIKRIYGQELLDEMELLQSVPPVKLTIDEVREKISIAKKIVKELKEADEVYTPEQRIFLRRKYNNVLGIYQNTLL